MRWLRRRGGTSKRARAPSVFHLPARGTTRDQESDPRLLATLRDEHRHVEGFFLNAADLASPHDDAALSGELGRREATTGCVVTLHVEDHDRLHRTRKEVPGRIGGVRARFLSVSVPLLDVGAPELAVVVVDLGVGNEEGLGVNVNNASPATASERRRSRFRAAPRYPRRGSQPASRPTWSGCSSSGRARGSSSFQAG